MVVEIEKFFGCYLLYCTNPKYKGRTYIGYTVDPRRRITQHNKGSKFGGACRTSGKGPWEMVLIIHGFPNNISALRFEWAWQHPKRSRRLCHLTGKQKKENQFQFCFRILSNMLRVGPWNRLPLTIRWLKQDFKIDFEPSLLPPTHMPIAYGPVKSVTIKKKGGNVEVQNEEDEILILSQGSASKRCDVCVVRLKEGDPSLECVHPGCTLICHTVCLAKKFVKHTDYLVPVEGKCPKCKNMVLWGDLIRKSHGCYGSIVSDSQDDGDGDWAELNV
ncbi:structure-specific endonuclease subunit slx1-like [Saccoglossus kowalevskii]